MPKTCSITSSCSASPEYQADAGEQEEACSKMRAIPPRRSSAVASGPRRREYREKNFAREALTVNPGQGLPAARRGVRRRRLREDACPSSTARRAASPTTARHFSRHFKEPISCVSVVDDRGRGGVRRPQQHDRRARQRLQAMYKPKMIAVSHDLHGRGDRRRPQRLHQDRQGEGLSARRNSTFRSRTRRPSSAATSPATTTC